MSNNGGKEYNFINDLPYFEYKKLCRLLDYNDKWEELGGEHMDFDVLTIHELRRCFQRDDSPSEELLHRWGHQNHTILELFALLSKMQYYRAMKVLKPFVHEKYHKLIYEGEQFLNLAQRAKHLEESRTNKTIAAPSDSTTGRSNAIEAATDSNKFDKDLQVGTHNLNLPSEPGRMPPSKVIHKPNFHHEVKVVNTVVPQAEQPADVSNERNDNITVGAYMPLNIPVE